MKYARGTWESNPGPNVYPLHIQPSELRAHVVLELASEQHNMTQRLVMSIARKFKRAYDQWTRPPSSSCFL